MRRGEICNGARLVQIISACLLTLNVDTHTKARCFCSQEEEDSAPNLEVGEKQDSAREGKLLEDNNDNNNYH